jgi:hypothetical protein
MTKVNKETQIINIQINDPKKIIEQQKDISRVGFTDIKKVMADKKRG